MRRWGWIVVVVAAMSCSPEKYLDTPEKPARTISMSLQTSTASVAQGGEASVLATVTRVGGGPTPTVTVENVPSGVTASLVNTDPVDGVFKSTLTLRAASDAKVGQYTVAMRAHADGVVDAVLTIALTVLDAPKLALTLSRPTVTVARGGATPTSLAIGRTTVSAPVTLSLEGAAGVTADFATNPVTGDTVGIVVRAGSQLVAGTYQAVIKASVPGLPDQTVALTVTVIPDRLQLIGSSPIVVAQGQSATSNMIVNQTDLVGAIALSLDNAPAGISATFQPGANGVVPMAIAVAPSTAPGAYTVTVRGKASDGTTATTDVVVNVIRASVSLTVQPDTLVIFQGTSATTTLSLARAQFAGSVVVSAENVPANVTVTGDPASVSGNSTTVRAVAAANATPSTTDVTIRGTLAGFPPSASATAKLVVIVRQAPTGGNVILDWSRCGAPPFVAYQDGTGGWTPAEIAGNVARFTIASSSGGFAYADNENVIVRYMTQSEMTASPIDLCELRTGTNTVTGTAQHTTASEFFAYDLGGGVGTSATNATNITITGVRDGVHDLVGFGSQLATGRAYIARDIAVPPTTSLGVVELGGPNGFGVSRAGVNVVGPVNGDGLVQSMSYLTTAACTVNPLYSNSFFGALSAQTLGFPPSVQRPTDFHMMTVTANRIGQVRTTTLTFHTFANVTLTLPPLLTTPTLDVLPGPYLRERATFSTIPAIYNSSISLRYTEGRHVMQVTASIAYAGSNNPVLAMPDLSGVAGWQNSYAYATGAAGSWSTSADGSNGGVPCTEGRATYNATVSGTLP